MCQYLLSALITSAANCRNPPSRLQTGTLSQSGGLFSKSSLVIPRSLCVSYLPAFFKNPSPPPWSTPLSCPLFSICFLTSYLPSFLQAYPSPLADLTVCLSNRSQVMEAGGCHSTIWRLLIHLVHHREAKFKKKSHDRDAAHYFYCFAPKEISSCLYFLSSCLSSFSAVSAAQSSTWSPRVVQLESLC